MKVLKNYSLKNLNTFGVDVKSKYLLEIFSEEELKQVLKSEEYSNHNKLTLGGGSNILFTKDFDGLVIKNSISGMELFDEDKNNAIVEAGAGVIWEDLVKYCVGKNYGGIENLSYIPGTVGAAPIQNIGAYGQEFEQIFFELSGIYIDSGKTKIFNKSECGFSYRNSVFKNELKNRFIITSVRLRLNKNPDVNLSYNPVKEEVKRRNLKYPTIKDIREIVIEIRKNKLPDPNELGNAGSFFKNPVISEAKFNLLKKEYPDLNYYNVDDDNFKIPAAWLIEKCGWKGRRLGNSGTHKMQPLVIVNFGSASGKEIYDLSTMIKSDVKKTFDIILEYEVNIL